MFLAAPVHPVQAVDMDINHQGHGELEKALVRQ